MLILRKVQKTFYFSISPPFEMMRFNQVNRSNEESLTDRDIIEFDPDPTFP